MELTPSDELESKYLTFLCIQRLHKILRMQFGNDLDLELRDILEKVDRLWSIHANDAVASVAAVAAAEPADRESGQAGGPVAANAPFRKKKRDQEYGCHDYGHKGRNAAVTSDRKASGLCRFHWKWGVRRPIPAPFPARGR